MRDERRGVNPSFGNEAEDFGTVASVHPARLEGEVLAVHIGQRKHLRTVVERHDGDRGIGAGTLPRQAEGVVGSRHLQHHIGTTVVGVRADELRTALRLRQQHVGIVGLHEGTAFGRLLAHDDTLGALQHRAEQGADARRSGTDDKHGILRRNVRYACRPKAGGQDITHEECLLVRHIIGDAVKPLVGMGHTDKFRLPTVDAAAQSPTSVGVGAVVHIAFLAKETLAAEGLHVHGDAVARTDIGDGTPHLLHHAHNLVAYGDARHGTRHAAMLDVQVAGADAAQGDADNGVVCILQHRFRLVQEAELALLDIRIC